MVPPHRPLVTEEEFLSLLDRVSRGHRGPLIERRTGPGLAEEELVEGVLTTPLLPGFSLDVAALYAER